MQSNRSQSRRLGTLRHRRKKALQAGKEDSMQSNRSRSRRLGDLRFATSAAAEAGASKELRRAKLKWVAIARWMAAATKRRAALRRDRLRHGWRIDAAAAAAACVVIPDGDHSPGAAADA